MINGNYFKSECIECVGGGFWRLDWCSHDYIFKLCLYTLHVRFQKKNKNLINKIVLNYFFKSGDLKVCYNYNSTQCTNPLYPTQCGDLMCAEDSRTCGLKMAEIVLDALRVAAASGLDDNLAATMEVIGCDGTVFEYIDTSTDDWSDLGDFRKKRNYLN